ncbi:MAG: SoxR reducing system RseC family protein [Bacteroidales bacterium]|nr:SoxR reducing system RseC family protein [Bacteroidales bacterium]
MAQPVTHPGTVVATKKGLVTVQIESVSACASCQAHSRCGFAESKTKTLDIPLSRSTAAADRGYSVGDAVVVTIDPSRGLLATLFAYLLPALILLAVVVTLSLLGIPEPLVILVALAALALYTLLLYLFRRPLDNHFTLTLSPAT